MRKTLLAVSCGGLRGLDKLAAAGGGGEHRAYSSRRVIYTLDTNILVDALRQATELDRLKDF